MITAFQIDEFGTTAKTDSNQVLRSNARPPMSFDYEIITFTSTEKTRFWQLDKVNLTDEQCAEVQRHIDSIQVNTELTNELTQNHQARKILAQTDWYVLRFLETGTPVPDNITDMRRQARENVAS
jgi:hypothetical protein|tara:strand:+ start:2223 stop:2597 length:375 start_codon:yes stop_codon:yes gene_type:complete